MLCIQKKYHFFSYFSSFYPLRRYFFTFLYTIGITESQLANLALTFLSILIHMKTTLPWLILAITMVAFLEIGQIVTEAPTSLFNINYFVKGAYLGLLLAAVGTLYLREALRHEQRWHVFVIVMIFLCAVASTVISFKFLIVGFVLHAVSDMRWGSGRHILYAGFDLVIVAYLIYLEYINVGDQIFFI